MKICVKINSVFRLPCLLLVSYDSLCPKFSWNFETFCLSMRVRHIDVLDFYLFAFFMGNSFFWKRIKFFFNFRKYFQKMEDSGLTPTTGIRQFFEDFWTIFFFAKWWRFLISLTGNINFSFSLFLYAFQDISYTEITGEMVPDVIFFNINMLNIGVFTLFCVPYDLSSKRSLYRHQLQFLSIVICKKDWAERKRIYRAIKRWIQHFPGICKTNLVQDCTKN